MAAALALLIIPNLSHTIVPRQLVDVDLSLWTPQRLALSRFETTTMAEVTPRWMAGSARVHSVAATVVSGDAAILRPGRTPFSWSSPVNGQGCEHD